MLAARIIWRGSAAVREAMFNNSLKLTSSAHDPSTSVGCKSRLQLNSVR